MKDAIPFLFSLYRANAVMTRRLAGHGLDFNDFMVIYYLNEAEGKQLKRVDLAHKLGLTASGATRLLIPLEKLGIVKRENSDIDSRARMATLTKAGEELLKNSLATLEMRLEDAIPEGKRIGLKNFTATLDEITENLLQPEYQAEAKDRWGNTEAYKQSKERLKKMTKEDMERIKKDGDTLMKEIASTMDKGASSREIQGLIKRHYNALRNFYEPNIEMYRGLGDMYVQDARFTAYFEKYKPGLAKFMQEAIKVFCEKNEK